MTWDIAITQRHYDELMAHLFPGDGDEHGAVLAAGIARSGGRTRLLVREVFLAREGIDYVPSQRGHRMLTATFVNQRIRYCRDHGLAYIAVHNHGGRGSVAFSSVDLESHRRGYPALLDIAKGPPVAALVLADGAAAAEIWTRDRNTRPATKTLVIGSTVRHLRPSPAEDAPPALAELDRQVRVLGHAGQRALQDMTIGVIGLGGVGSLLVQLLARMHVGHLVVVDPDRIDPTNLPRLPEATRRDAKTWIRRIPIVGEWIAKRTATPKTRLARRIARRANPKIKITPHRTSVTDPATYTSLAECDFLFLAADEHRARDAFNRLVHQYLIPGIQLGTHIKVSEEGAVNQILVNARKVTPDRGCLACNGLIDYTKVQQETLGAKEREAARYIAEEPAPSVMAYNGITASWAVAEFLNTMGGLQTTDIDGYAQFDPPKRTFKLVAPRTGNTCIDCGAGDRSVFARGDNEADHRR